METRASSFVYDSRQKSSSLLQTLMQIWDSRFITLALVKRDLQTKYKRSVLGIFWSFLNPILTTIIIYLVFSGIFAGRLPNDKGYLVYIYIGIVYQFYFLSGVVTCSNALANQWQFLTKMRIHPFVFSISSSISLLFQLLLSLIAIFPIYWISQFQFTPRVLLLPLYFYLALIFISGCGMALSGFVIRFDDANYVLTAIMMIAIYLTPIFYTTDILPQSMKVFVETNPFTMFLTLFRSSITSDVSFDLKSLLLIVIIAHIVFIIGLTRLKNRWSEWMLLL
jgi:ABC-2 type transport system permease protein